MCQIQASNAGSEREVVLHSSHCGIHKSCLTFQMGPRETHDAPRSVSARVDPRAAGCRVWAAGCRHHRHRPVLLATSRREKARDGQLCAQGTILDRYTMLRIVRNLCGSRVRARGQHTRDATRAKAKLLKSCNEDCEFSQSRGLPPKPTGGFSVLTQRTRKKHQSACAWSANQTEANL